MCSRRGAGSNPPSSATVDHILNRRMSAGHTARAYNRRAIPVSAIGWRQAPG